MSKEYDIYIEEHKVNVTKAFDWLCENVPELFINDEFMSTCEQLCKFKHDESKYEPEEYEAYDDYFYGDSQTPIVVLNFNKAWLHHIHNNPHHWQHWILVNDDPLEGEIVLDMPDEYIIEMLCDWLSFSFKNENLNEFFDWYVKRAEYMKLSDKTRVKVEGILEKIKEKCPDSDKGFKIKEMRKHPAS